MSHLPPRSPPTVPGRASASVPGAAATSDRLPLTALVTTFNEETNIGACLESVGWADELLVVDSFSSDDTCREAAHHTDRILQHPYESPARQKNWALAQARHRWVLILDADERATAELRAEICALLARGPERVAYWIHRRNTFLGREMRHGGWETDRVIRLVDRTHSRYPDVRVHEEMEVDGPVGVLRERLFHHSVRSLEQYGPKMERYSRWWAEERHARGRRATPWTVLSHTLGRFVRMYVLKRGFLDGGHGLLLALLASFSVYQKYAKLWELGLRRGPSR